MRAMEFEEAMEKCEVIRQTDVEELATSDNEPRECDVFGDGLQTIPLDELMSDV